MPKQASLFCHSQFKIMGNYPFCQPNDNKSFSQLPPSSFISTISLPKFHHPFLLLLLLFLFLFLFLRLFHLDSFIFRSKYLARISSFSRFMARLRRFKASGFRLWDSIFHLFLLYEQANDFSHSDTRLVLT